MKTAICLAASLLIALAAATPWAAEEVAPPKVHNQGGSTYVTGGSGEAQRRALFKIANEFPNQLIFEFKFHAK